MTRASLTGTPVLADCSQPEIPLHTQRHRRFFGQHRPAEPKTGNPWQSRSERHRESWKLDSQHLDEQVVVREQMNLRFRMDATNIFNHPTPGDPAGLGNFGSSLIDTFGQVTTKTGNRQFQGSLRLSF